ncbi:MAG: ATP-dependent zinc metalloprotease FtsH [Candidatus Buchananbacteria bacterium]|nr:ATP-dependent zinc metalloprotease FtsH [Candidatus Buchananbacteria bacterium]
MKKITRQLLIAFLVFLIFASILSFISLPAEKPANITITQLLDQIDKNQVESITVRANSLDIKLVGGAKQVLEKEPSESLSTLLKNYNVDTEKLKNIAIDVKADSGTKFWASIILPFLIPLLFILGFFWFMMRQAQGANNKAMSFGQSRAREFNPDKKLKTTFNDVAGVKEAKKELVEVVEFLKNPKKFLALGAKIPKGVLLLGAPGTGKTLLAKAVAGEANVPFFSISGSEFVEMFVGVGASRVRDLFSKAKKNSPCIVFIDELDAVGRQRGAGLGGSHDEREQTLNQILVEMDGFDPRTNVIVMAATNRPDVLDSALLRPGRFDRRVTLDMPDINDRESILKVHAANKPMAKDVTLRKIAERTPGFSGADLSNLLNEAAISAALENKKEVSEIHILDSIDKVLLGPERKSHILSTKEKEITAYHEAGHALVAHELPNTDPVRKVSIVARGSAAGFTLKLPLEDKKLHTKTEFLEELAVMLAGQIAEKITFNEVTTGAQSDLRQSTKLAKRLITEYGMSEKMGLRTFGEKEELIFLGKEIHERRDYSEKTAEDIDAEIHRLTEDAAKLAEKIIKEKKKYLDRIVTVLIEKETIESEEFESLFTRE